MALSHAGRSIPGGDHHSNVMKSRGELQTWRTTFEGVVGVSEIRSKTVGPEQIEILMWLGGKATADKVAADVVALDRRRGDHGTLRQTGTINTTIKNCTFEGFQPTALGGQAAPAPCLGTDGLYYQPGTLTFTTMKDP